MVAVRCLSLVVARCPLCCSLLVVVRWLRLFVMRWWLFAVRCLLFLVCCLLFVVRGLLSLVDAVFC